MSEEAGWSPNWWQEARDASLTRRAAKPFLMGAAAKPGDAFLIVTEGVVTEPVYFEQLFTTLPLSSARVRVRPGNASDPRHVIKTAAREAKEQVRRAKKGCLGIDEPPKFDQVWAVIDTDVAVRNGIWNDVVQLATARKVKLAHSTRASNFGFCYTSSATQRAAICRMVRRRRRLSGQRWAVIIQRTGARLAKRLALSSNTGPLRLITPGRYAATI